MQEKHDNNEAFKVKFRGVRGSIPSPSPETVKYGGNTLCIETITSDDEIIILDAGTGIRMLGQELASRPNLNIHLFITHTHWDHIQGFPFFIPLYIPGHRVTVYGPSNQIDGSLKDIMTRQMDYATFPVKLGELQAKIEFVDLKEETLSVGNTTIQTKNLNHPVFTLGYRLTHHGKSLVYQTDHEPYYNIYGTEESDDAGETAEMQEFVKKMNQRIIDFSRESDLLIADTMYTHDEYAGKVGWGHSSARQVMEQAIKARVKKLGVYHHEPNHSDTDLEEMLAGINKHVAEADISLDVFLAQENDVVEV